MIPNAGEFLAHDRLYDLVVRTGLCFHHVRIHAKFLVLHIQRQCAIFQYSCAFQKQIVTQLTCGPDPDINASIRRAQIVAGLRYRNCILTHKSSQ